MYNKYSVAILTIFKIISEVLEYQILNEIIDFYFLFVKFKINIINILFCLITSEKID